MTNAKHAEIKHLDPHAPLPGDLGRHVLLLRRFDEEQPGGVHLELSLVRGPGDIETVNPRRPDGSEMPFNEAIAAARKVAESEGLSSAFVVDRTAGARERAILSRGGNHAAEPGDQDSNLDDHEKGSDLRPSNMPTS